MKEKVTDSYQRLIDDFLKFDILIKCPSCSLQAVVKTDAFTFIHSNDHNPNIKAVCIHCGFNKLLNHTPKSVLYSSSHHTIKARYIIVGAPVDPFFHYPLWLSMGFENNILWAYNAEHLAFLKLHIAAYLRERNNQEYVNKSLGSRLPAWMLAKENRTVLLKKIEQLQKLIYKS